MAKGTIPNLASDHVFNKTLWDEKFADNDNNIVPLESVDPGEEARAFRLEMIADALADKTKFGY